MIYSLIQPLYCKFLKRKYKSPLKLLIDCKYHICPYKNNNGCAVTGN